MKISLKKIIVFTISLVLAVTTSAQSLADAKQFFYYEKFKTAKATLEKLVGANGADVESAYLLGQVLLRMEKTVEAKAVYRKAMDANTTSGLLLAGMGQVLLTEGKEVDARNTFEAAIGLSKAKDATVLAAIANAISGANKGDAAYGIEKAKLATTLKGGRTVDNLMALAEAQKYSGDGGLAKQYYNEVLLLNPKYAKAAYKIGKLYQSQGDQQVNVFMPYFNDAERLDPNYAPNYYNLYNYFINSDLNKAGTYLDKYIATTEEDQRNCYYKAQLKFQQKDFSGASSDVDKCIANAGNDVYPSFFGLKAYISRELKDSIASTNNFATYFSKITDKEKISTQEYLDYGSELLKVSGKENDAFTIFNQAAAKTSKEEDKVKIYKKIANYFLAKQDNKKAGDVFAKINTIKAQPSGNDFYNAGYNLLLGKDLIGAQAQFERYVAAYPTEFYGHYFLASAKDGLDSAKIKTNAAIPDFEKAESIGQAFPDKASIKSAMGYIYSSLFSYQLYQKKDKAGCEKLIEQAKLFDATMPEVTYMEAKVKAATVGGKPTPPSIKTPTTTNGTKVTTPATPKAETPAPKGGTSVPAKPAVTTKTAVPAKPVVAKPTTSTKPVVKKG